MKIIVAVDTQWGIGFEGKLLQHIPEDMKMFKEKTMGNIVVMGRETFESLPNKSPLNDRINIVLTRDKNFIDDRVIICNSVEETLEKLKIYNSNNVFIIGGESIYKKFLPYCDTIYLTKINRKYIADKYFPNLDNNNEWNIIDKSNIKTTKQGVEYYFITYCKNNK